MDFQHSFFFLFVISPETSLFMTKSPLRDVVNMDPKNKRLGFLHRGNSLGPRVVIKRDVVLKFLLRLFICVSPHVTRACMKKSDYNLLRLFLISTWGSRMQFTLPGSTANAFTMTHLASPRGTASMTSKNETSLPASSFQPHLLFVPHFLLPS